MKECISLPDLKVPSMLLVPRLQLQWGLETLCHTKKLSDNEMKPTIRVSVRSIQIMSIKNNDTKLLHLFDSFQIYDPILIVYYHLNMGRTLYHLAGQLYNPRNPYHFPHVLDMVLDELLLNSKLVVAQYPLVLKRNDVRRRHYYHLPFLYQN